MENDDIRYGGFKVTSHFDRGSHEFTPKEQNGARSVESSVTAALDTERRKASRATVALLDFRANIEDQLEVEQDDHVRDVLSTVDRTLQDILEFLN